MDLPTPYAQQDDEESTPSAMKSRIESRDKWRGRWTKLAVNTPFETSKIFSLDHITGSYRTLFDNT